MSVAPVDEGGRQVLRFTAKDDGLKLTLKGTKQGVVSVLFVSARGEAKLIALNVVAKA